MPGAGPTASERAFAKYCEARGYAVASIPRSGSSTPDFEVTANGAHFIAEIKEFTPNPHDKRQARELVTRGSSGGTFDGQRVRRALEEAAAQLRRLREKHLPMVVVLYDNIIVNGIRPYARCPYFDPTQIEWGMYGQHVADVRVPPRGPAIPLGDRRGGKREFTEENRTYISAVAVLADRGESAWFFHNYFASIPLSRGILDDERDRHFHNPSNPLQSLVGWAELMFRV